jgi:hypothetical protein
MRKRYLLLVSLLGAVPLSAAEPEPAACVREIQSLCPNQDKDLEKCFQERKDKLSSGCRTFLSNAFTMVHENSGAGACVEDVQRECPDLNATILADCIKDKQSHFSNSCQDYLGAAKQKASSQTRPSTNQPE